MTILFVGSDGAKWGSGLGRRLTVTEHDNNNWQFLERLVALEGATAYAGITGFSITGTTGAPGSKFNVDMSDGSHFGPFDLPVAKFKSRGAYAGGASFAVNDVFTINGSLYLVNVPHVSPTGFNPSLNDGAGHDYYSELIPTPTGSLPTGGSTGYNLRKLSSSNFDVGWAPPLPVGGATGQYLAKNSSTYFDAGWITPPKHSPPTGPAGYVLGLLSTGIDDFDWIPPVPLGGGTGFALIKNSDADLDYSWALAVPAGGATGYVLTKNSGADFDYAWAALPTGGGSATGTVPSGGVTGAYLRKSDSADYAMVWSTDGEPARIESMYATGVWIEPQDRAKIIQYVAGDLTLNFTGPTGFKGNFEILFAAVDTTPFNILMGTGYKHCGTGFDTGTVFGATFISQFAGDGVYIYEINRYGPIVVLSG